MVKIVKRFMFAWGYAYQTDKWKAFASAYKLGDPRSTDYLIRELPIHCKLEKQGITYSVSHSRIDEEGGWFYAEASTPEEALLRLKEQLQDKGVIK